MRYRTFLGGGAAIAALALTGCSSSPEIAGVDANGLIAACLDGASPVAQDSNTLIEGTVSSVNAEDDDEDGTTVNIVFDARDKNNTADPAQCTLTISGEKVTEFDLDSPDSEPGSEVEDVAEKWNDKHAEDWIDGKGPDPVQAPPPEGESSHVSY